MADYRNTMVLPEGMDMVSSAPLFCAGITGKLLFKFMWLASVPAYAQSHQFVLTHAKLITL